MTNTPLVTKSPCETSEECLHTTCKVCGFPLRSTGHRAEDHQGTIMGHPTFRLCRLHGRHGNADVLTEDELAWMKTTHPHAYQFHKNRRDRGIPPHGIKLKGDK